MNIQELKLQSNTTYKNIRDKSDKRCAGCRWCDGGSGAYSVSEPAVSWHCPWWFPQPPTLPGLACSLWRIHFRAIPKSLGFTGSSFPFWKSRKCAQHIVDHHSPWDSFFLGQHRKNKSLVPLGLPLGKAGFSVGTFSLRGCCYNHVGTGDLYCRESMWAGRMLLSSGRRTMWSVNRKERWCEGSVLTHGL